MTHILLLTLREVMRKRFLFVSVILSGLFLLLYGLGLHYAVAEFIAEGGSARMTLRVFVVQLASLAIYMSTFITAFFVVFSSAHTMAGELEGEELLAVASRPIFRRDIVLGKFFGIAVAAVLFSAALLGAILSLSTLISGEGFQNITRVLALYCLQPLTLLSVTLLFSMFMKTIAAGISGMLLYMLGVIGGSTEQITAMVNPGSRAAEIAGMAHYVIPTDALYRLLYTSLGADLGLPFSGGGPFGAARVPEWWMAAYAGGYIVVMLTAALVVFRRKDL
jgi:ABC-type transport system involved in multi-copper enzyme maturation permease subunit